MNFIKKNSFYILFFPFIIIGRYICVSKNYNNYYILYSLYTPLMFKSILTFFQDILSPKLCYSCWVEWILMCDLCFAKQDNFWPFCYICKKASKEFKIHKKCLIENKTLDWKNFNNLKVYFSNVIVVTHYKNKVIKKIITQFKFFGKKAVWQELWVKMWELLENNTQLNKKEELLLLPVPMYFFRKILRWYNQSDILAQSIAKKTGICYNNNILKRIKHTRQQSLLSQERRIENLRGAFKIKKKYLDKIDKKIIILVDDVISTWSTVNEISKVLKQNWARKVIVLCLASN